MGELHVDIGNKAACALEKMGAVLAQVDSARARLESLDACRNAEEVEAAVKATDDAMMEARVLLMETRAELGKLKVYASAGKICGMMQVPDPARDRTELLASLHRAGDHTLGPVDVVDQSDSGEVMHG